MDSVAGTMGNCVGIVIGQPLDTVKVRLQAEPGLYSGPLDCFWKTVRHEGVSALWKGVMPPVLGNAPMGGLLFFGYGQSGRTIEEYFGALPDGAISYWRVATCAMAGGTLATLATTPVELIKCKLQVQHGSLKSAAAAVAVPQYSGVLDCARQLVRAKGLRGLYSGFAITSFRDVPAFVRAAACCFLCLCACVGACVVADDRPLPGRASSTSQAVYFCVYEYLKRALTPAAAAEAPAHAMLVAGGVAGMATVRHSVVLVLAPCQR